MKETRTIDTALGPAPVLVWSCDTCAQLVPARSSSYTPHGWHRVEIGYDPTQVMPPAEQRYTDFCCVDCLLRHFAPDMYDPSSLLAQDSIEKVQKIRMDLEQA